MEIWELGATRQAAAIRSRELSSREVVSTHLERIEAVNPAVNALRARGAGADRSARCGRGVRVTASSRSGDAAAGRRVEATRQR